MSTRRRRGRVCVVGLGDLGWRVLEGLARLPLELLTAASRDEERTRALAGQAALVAALHDGAARVEATQVDLDDPESAARCLARAQPDVIVAAASSHTWWRTPLAAARLPYGAWLPLHVPAVRAVTTARAAVAPAARVLALPYPDGVGPVLAPLGLAPDLGGGNVAEVAAKLAHLAAQRHGTGRDEVEVRIVVHHAAERLAFAGLSSLGGARAPAGRPPVWLRVGVAGEALDRAEVEALFHAPFPLAPGRGVQGLTAASTVVLVAALLADEPRILHAPAPGGRPGGFPLRISATEIALALPPELSERDAISVNTVAARWDGIERVDAEGGLTFTLEVEEELERTLGIRPGRILPDDHPALADELAQKLSELAARGA